MLSRAGHSEIEYNGILSDIFVCNKTVTQESHPPHPNITNIGSGATGKECIEDDPLVLTLRSD